MTYYTHRHSSGFYGMKSHKTKREAMEDAQKWCTSPAHSATISRGNRGRGPDIMRYWYDGGLQFMEY